MARCQSPPPRSGPSRDPRAWTSRLPKAQTVIDPPADPGASGDGEVKGERWCGGMRGDVMRCEGRGFG